MKGGEGVENHTEEEAAAFRDSAGAVGEEREELRMSWV